MKAMPRLFRKSPRSSLAPCSPKATPGCLESSPGMNCSVKDLMISCGSTLSCRHRRHRNRALPIQSRDARVTFSKRDVGDRTEWHLVTLWRTNAHVLEIGDRASLVNRIANHHLELVFAALDALRFFAIKRLANLPPQRRHRQPQGLRLRLDRQFDFFAAGRRGIRNIEYALIICQLPLQFGSRTFEHGVVGPAEPET